MSSLIKLQVHLVDVSSLFTKLLSYMYMYLFIVTLKSYLQD